MLKPDRCAAVAVLLIAVACNQPVTRPKKAVAAASAGPQVRATVVTIRNALQPGDSITTTTLVIGSDVARQANEIAAWRLFDVKNERVAFVDDIAKTYRWESLDSLEQHHAEAGTRAVADGIPRAQYVLTPVRRLMLGVPATQAHVTVGGYHRELWIGEHPLIPPALFALMQASEEPGSGAPMTAQANAGLLSARGFPLLDHTEVPYGKSKFVVDRAVVKIERKNVPEALLRIPADYRDITEPAAHRPAASSPLRGRRTPEAGSRSSGTGRKGP